MPVRLPSVPNPKADEAFTTTSRGGRPVLFQVTDPMRQPLYPVLLAMHVNPSSLDEAFAKSKNVVMTYGGFVEFNWPDELDTVSASASTGGFLGPGTGLTSGSDNTGGSFGQPSLAAGGRGRQATMAWERQEDLLELFRNNGIVFNGRGQPVLRGRVMMIYDRGVYMGHFTSFEVKETDEKAFTFDISWEFAVEESIYVFPGAATRLAAPGQAGDGGAGKTRLQTQAELESDLVSGRGVFEQNGDDVSPPVSPGQSSINQTLFPGAANAAIDEELGITGGG